MIDGSALRSILSLAVCLAALGCAVTASVPGGTGAGMRRRMRRVRQYTSGNGPMDWNPTPCGEVAPNPRTWVARTGRVMTELPSCNRPYGHDGAHMYLNERFERLAEWRDPLGREVR